LRRGLGQGPRAGRGQRRVARLTVCAGAVLLLVVGFGAGIALQSYTGTRTSLAELADAAVEQHQKLVRDLLPPDIKDVSPKVAEEWFKKRLAFNVSLPELKTERLHFLGGRISHLREIEVAALEYRVDGNNVSLFIIPEEAYRQLRLNDKPRFKVVSHRGYDVVIWRSQGAGYTLVSEIGDRPGEPAGKAKGHSHQGSGGRRQRRARGGPDPGRPRQSGPGRGGVSQERRERKGVGAALGHPAHRQRQMRFQAACAGHPSRGLRDRQLGSGAAQHAWVLREAHRVQRGATEPGSAHQAAA